MQQQKWQIGVSDLDAMSPVRWQDDYVWAETQAQAEALAEAKGYYRNLRLRIV